MIRKERGRRLFFCFEHNVESPLTMVLSTTESIFIKGYKGSSKKLQNINEVIWNSINMIADLNREKLFLINGDPKKCH